MSENQGSRPAGNGSTGRRPPGYRWAAQIRHFPSPVLRMRYRGGVVINPSGMPEWDLLARAMVRLPDPYPGLTIDEVRVLDVLTANRVMAATGDPLWAFTAADRVTRTPPGWAWAHIFATRQVALVPADAYAAFRHWGGAATMRVGRNTRGITVDDFTPVALEWDAAVTEGLMAKLEELLGYRLPEAYRVFLASTNGATPTTPGLHSRFGFVVDQPFFGLARQDRHQDLIFVSSWFSDRLTAEFLPIGYVQGGLLALKIGGADTGSVWYHDGDDSRDDDAYQAEHICAHLLGRCADDFDAFWLSLSVAPRRLLHLVERTLTAGAAAPVTTDDMGASLPANRRRSEQPRS